MITMTLSDGEHALKLYNDDNGHGLTYCDARVGPWDKGPNEGEVQCEVCKEKVNDEMSPVRQDLSQL